MYPFRDYGTTKGYKLKDGFRIVNKKIWSNHGKKSCKGVVKAIQRNTEKKYSSEEKIRIILYGLRGEVTIADLCRREGVNPNIYYRRSKDFMEAGNSRLTGNTLREANSNEAVEIRKENSQLKELVAELSLKNRVLKKSYDGLEKGFEEL